METKMTTVTPRMARDWLASNTNNRPLRPGVVERFMNAYRRGEWKETHQGIAFGKSGCLLDGQHRLTFIANLEDGESARINVTTGQDDKTFDAIDVGFGRTMSDIYGASAGSIAVARFFAQIYNSGASAGLTHQFVKPFLDWCMPEYEQLVTFCPSTVKVWSSSSIRAAAVCQMKRGYDHDFIKVAYHAMVHADVESMPYAARLMFQQYIGGRIVSSRGLDVFSRAMRVFDSTNNVKMTRLRVDQDDVIADVRKWLTVQMKKSPDKAGLTVAKPGAKFNWKKAA